MCLQVSRWYHFFSDKPKIAKKDIHVTKNLCKRSTSQFQWEWETPYMGYRIKFKKGCITIRSSLLLSRKIDGSRFVTKGIHAYRRREEAVSYSGYPFYAIIPKGSRYYIGKDGDIVSDKLIIFQTYSDYRNY